MQHFALHRRLVGKSCFGHPKGYVELKPCSKNKFLNPSLLTNWSRIIHKMSAIKSIKKKFNAATKDNFSFPLKANPA